MTRMLQHAVRITTGSRLHLGMFSFGRRPDSHAEPRGDHSCDFRAARQFGGVGLMVEEPAIRLTVRPAPISEATGPFSNRVLDMVRRASAALELPEVPQCHIRIESRAREHVGLGTGTQLGMAVSTAVHILAGRPLGLPAELAETVGRGRRSAIGTHGFALGGLLVEAGKRRAEEISPLVARLELPADWRLLLLLPKNATGLSGEAEREAFARLPPVPQETTAALCCEALLHLLPAAAEADFKAFSASVQRFGELAGRCFAACQPGTFFGPAARALAARMRELGIVGVGQSSWGPTIFAFMPSESAGHAVQNQLGCDAEAAGFDCILTTCKNHGARVEVE